MKRATILAIGALLPLVGGCGAGAFDAADERVTLGRLAAQGAWHACTRDSSANGPPCSAPSRTKEEFDRLADAARAARQRLDTDSSAAAMHEAAVLTLRVRDSSSTALDDAARLLDRARRRDTASATILNDFAVVQLEIGEREQNVQPFLAALDAIERAVARDSTFAPALFNRALIRERLSLLSSAQTAWSRYLKVEGGDGWRREGQQHDTSLRHAATPWSMSGGRDEVFGILGDWGRAAVARDAARATALLDSARRVVVRLDSAGDQSVSLSLATIDSRRDAAARLAAAHIEYSDGFAAHARAALEEAATHLERAEREFRALGSPAASWAAAYRASAEMQQARYDLADSLLGRVIAEASPSQHALIGKAIATRGVIQVRRGNYETANRYYREAATHLTRSGEPYNEGGTLYLLAESMNLAGQSSAGRGPVYHALRLLAPYRTSSYLNNQLTTVARYARADSLPYAALAVMDEVVSVAPGVGRPDALALAYRTRAADLFTLGRRDSARAELETAMKATATMTGHTQEQIRADIQLVQGQLMRAYDPRGALPILEDAANAYTRLGADSKSSAAMYETAIAARDAGDTVRARGWLTGAIAQIERQQSTFQSAQGRASLLETADNAFDAMIAIEARGGRSDSSFAYLERERGAARVTSSDGPPSLNAIGQRLPNDMLFVEYALLRDQVLAWTATRRGITTHVWSVSRDTIAALVRRFRQEATVAAPRAGDARSRLYDLLLRPLAAEMDNVGQIAVVGDRELSGLPFAALWDGVKRRYVVEQYRVRTLPSGAFLYAALDPTRQSGRAGSALVVGNPTQDSLGLLPGAEREANRVAKFYSQRFLLTGPSARRDTVLALLPRPRVFHFAGHAVFDGDQPELSYLALGPSRDGKRGGALTAREIGDLRLTNLELVVLSACRTVSSRTSRTGGVAGLASSFLRAGAPAIVSTLWDVSDDVTEPLLATFHERFAAGMPAAEALRQAQLQALGAPTGRRVAPAEWAAFIYTGP